MCGIVGLIDYNNSIDYGSILSMVNSLKHRGPDNSDFFLSENKHIFLGHTRLSILDLKLTGSQPFVSQSKNLVLTYNGEIYNFNNIKKELNSSFGKINWKSGTDTEVLINSIEYLGLLKTLSILRGMFAFALFDIKKNCISLVRDNVGEKPLYYGFNKGKFYFGSDLIAFESNKNFSKDIDKKSLGNYFKYNYIPSPKSIYSDIYKLKPGNILTLDLNKVHLGEESFNINEYWSIDNFNQKKIIKKDYNINKINIKKKLTRSVEEQLTSSDIETSVMLSSGIDSSLVASIASKIKKNLTTYSLGFKNKKFDESKQAYKIAAHLNTKHYNFEMGLRML
jgi:asparagine synthase (glutamine-hydrolysing)